MTVIGKAWYPVLRSDELTVAPVKITVIQTDIVLFRDANGVAHGLSAYCPHRGCDLACATVNGDELVCAFHGWRFNLAGHCTCIPANRVGMQIPPSAQLNRFPTCERMGLVWAYPIPVSPGQPDPDLILFDESTSEDFRSCSFDTMWRANFCRVVESVLDVSHLPFVHPETTGQGVCPTVEGPDYAVVETGIVIHPTPFVTSHPLEAMPSPPGIDKRTEIELIFPNRWIIRTPMGDGNWMCTVLAFCPIGRESTRIFGWVMRNFDLDSEFLDEFHLEHTHFVMRQDREIIECLRPIVAPELRLEAHVPSDGPTIRFRTMLFDALAAENDDFV